MPKFFISAIDTDAGKTIATGLLAKTFCSLQLNTITTKLAQTGCEGISSDIQTHRELMGIELTAEDTNGTTCPYLFKYPASPHLASNLENKPIDVDVINEKISLLEKKYDHLLIEGVGGLMVPITPSYLVVDYVKDNKLPMILVTSGKLGSINHTLLTLSCCIQQNIEVVAIIYNQFPQTDSVLSNETATYVKQYGQRLFPNLVWFDMPILENLNNFDASQWHSNVIELIGRK